MAGGRSRERSRHRESSSRRDRDPDRERKRRSRRAQSSRPQSKYDIEDEETPQSTPRPKRRSRSHSQSAGRGNTLSADALAALNSQNQRGSGNRGTGAGAGASRDASRDARAAQRASRAEAKEREKISRENREERERERAYVEAATGYRDSREHRQSRNYRDSRQYYSGDEYQGADSYAEQMRQDKRRSRHHDYEGDMREEDRRRDKRGKKRMVSGADMEEGRATHRGRRGGGASRPESEQYMLNEKERQRPPKKKLKLNKKRILLFGGVVLALLATLIAVAVVITKQKGSDAGKEAASDIDNIDKSSIPISLQGTDLDPFTWYDTSDFNLTFTEETVGDLPVMGLFSEWDDSAQANSKVPALDSSWSSYDSRPARGVNVGGWLNLEPFITPSLFSYDDSLGIIDEWTLSSHLGDGAKAKLETHYATFVTEQTFAAIAQAGLDHVRIPYGYWAVQTYDGDPYVFRTSWRYLLRGIEWARKHGLRINLDIHGLPGSQNGWNHSGRQGKIGWLDGTTEGERNAERSLEIHKRLATFFAQDRYKNIISFYGLGNEPKMTSLKPDNVVAWTAKAYKVVKDAGLKDAIQVFGDGFMGLGNWKGQLAGYKDLALDVHQYVIFNTNQIVFTHKQKIKYACEGWGNQAEESMDTSTGYGPTVFAEWSQADTDCARNLNNVGQGNRWEGTFVVEGEPGISATSPRCPTKDGSCTCSDANADPSRWSKEYKRFLKYFAEAQMTSFEKGWGWWYWTWDTEGSPQWSYKKGLDAGVLPEKAYEREFNCDEDVDFPGLPEYY